MTAKAMLEEDFPDRRIEVINSWVATGAQALLLMEMARMQKNGKSMDDVLAYVEKARVDARIHFMVGDLSYLEVGGRIGKLATLSGGLLKIKPIIILKDGEIGIGGVCRARKKGLTQIADVTKKHFKEKKANKHNIDKTRTKLKAMMNTANTNLTIIKNYITTEAHKL
jgi:DegV family protein with EDD domain